MTFPSYGISKGIPVRFYSAGDLYPLRTGSWRRVRSEELVIAANSRRRILAISKPPRKVSKTNRIVLIQTVERVPVKVSGVWLFKGTRVPVKALFENLEDGAGVDDFLRWFPGVKREQVLAVLEFASCSFP